MSWHDDVSRETTDKTMTKSGNFVKKESWSYINSQVLSPNLKEPHLNHYDFKDSNLLQCSLFKPFKKCENVLIFISFLLFLLTKIIALFLF